MNTQPIAVWTADDAGTDPEAEAMAAELAAADRDAVMMWLVHGGGPELATRIMVGSVLAQAALLGLVTCSRCGDRGCDWCRPPSYRVAAL